MTAKRQAHISPPPATRPPHTGPVTSPTPPAPTIPVPAGRVVSWVGWHVVELAGVGVPLALAVSVNGWFAVLSALAGAGWASHEIQLARRTRNLHPARPQLTTTSTHDQASDQEGQGT